MRVVWVQGGELFDKIVNDGAFSEKEVCVCVCVCLPVLLPVAP